MRLEREGLDWESENAGNLGVMIGDACGDWVGSLEPRLEGVDVGSANSRTTCDPRRDSQFVCLGPEPGGRGCGALAWPREWRAVLLIDRANGGGRAIEGVLAGVAVVEGGAECGGDRWRSSGRSLVVGLEDVDLWWTVVSVVSVGEGERTTSLICLMIE